MLDGGAQLEFLVLMAAAAGSAEQYSAGQHIHLQAAVPAERCAPLTPSAEACACWFYALARRAGVCSLRSYCLDSQLLQAPDSVGLRL